MKLMFYMMNAARIEVGLQGAAAAGAAHQQALAYAKERLQSRHWKEIGTPMRRRCRSSSTPTCAACC